MIYFLLEKVIRCAHISIDCLRASKLVTLGYIYIYIDRLNMFEYEAIVVVFNARSSASDTCLVNISNLGMNTLIL